jgi:hypothetical protein
MGNPQSEARFPSSGSCRRKEIRARMGENGGHGASLPLTQFGRPGRQGHGSLLFLCSTAERGHDNEELVFILHTHSSLALAVVIQDGLIDLPLHASS